MSVRKEPQEPQLVWINYTYSVNMTQVYCDSNYALKYVLHVSVQLNHYEAKYKIQYWYIQRVHTLWQCFSTFVRPRPGKFF